MRQIITIIIFVTSQLCWADDFEWKEVSIEGQRAIECPYVLKFETKQRYKLFNDCYALEPTNSLLEAGTYTESEGEMSFFRKIIMGDNSIFTAMFGMNNRISVKVEMVPGKSLIIRAKDKEFNFVPAY